MSDLIGQRHRDITRPWRVVFIIAAVLLTVATHWPRLQLSPGIPATDKTIHAIAFATMTFLLWHTQWIRRRWVVVAVVLAWSLLDEWSQGISVLNRHVTGEDALANVMGVAIMGLTLWATSPIGGVANRVRLRLHEAAFDETFRDTRTWLILVSIVIACAGPVLLLVGLLGLRVEQAAILIATSVWIIATVWMFWLIRRHSMRWMLRTRACFECAASCRRARFDDAGQGDCPACRTQLHRGQWSLPTPPPLPLQSRLFVRPLLMGLGIVILGFSLLALAPIVYEAAISGGVGQSILPPLARTVMGVNPSLVRVIDAALLTLVAAIVIRLYRRRLAGFYDRADTCVACGHDLRGTPVTQGIGRCGECGQKFVVC